MDEEIADVKSGNIVKPNSQPKKKPSILRKGIAISSSSSRNSAILPNTTQIGHDFDPEKRKSPSKRRQIIRPKRKPQSQSYYRRRLEYFDQKQTGTKSEVTIFSEVAQQGLDLIPDIMDGKNHVQSLFPLYHKALNSYMEAMLKLRQTILTERKLAAEVWGDNSIASFNVNDGVYTVQKEAIQQLLMPRIDELKPVAETSKKQSTGGTKRKKPIQVEAVESTSDINDFIECDYMAVTRSQTRRSTGTVVKHTVIKEDVPLPVQRKTSNAKRKSKSPPVIRQPPPKKVRGPSPKETTPKTLPPPPPPPPVPSIQKNGKKVKEYPMPPFTIIEENEIARSAEDIIREPPVLTCTCKPDKFGKGCYDNCVNKLLHMECGSRCPIGDKCKNKKFQKRIYSGFEPFFAGAKGWGIRATKPIKSGDFIVEYVGEVVDSKEMEKRQKKYTKKNYKHHYMMCLKNKAVIDATIYGNYSRFVNHSCDPNAETQKWVVSKELRVGFFAKKDIAPGEEIVFDYAFERFGKEAQHCYCGATNCTGFIGSKPDEDDGEDEDDDSSDLTEASEDEAPKNIAAKKQPKPKLTQEEKDFRKKVAKTRRKLVKHRREIRKIIGRKKNFTLTDVLEFNRQMYRIESYPQRLLLLDFLLSTDDQWKTWFIENNGISVAYMWLADCKGYGIKNILRLQGALLNFLNTLPVQYNDDVKEKMLPILKERMDVTLPDSFVIQETVYELRDSICLTEELPISDKDLARLLNKDGVSVFKLHGELTETAKQLFKKWSHLPPRPPQPLKKADSKLIDISGDEEDHEIDIESQNDKPYAHSLPSPSDFDLDGPINEKEKSVSPHQQRSHTSSPMHEKSDSPNAKNNLLPSPCKSRERLSHSRSRSRSSSPHRRRKRNRSLSRSRSPINFGRLLHHTARRECQNYSRRSENVKDFSRNRYSQKEDRNHGYYYHQRDRRYDDRKYRGSHHGDRYRNGRHYGWHRDNRDYESHQRNRTSHYQRQHSNDRRGDRIRDYSISPDRTKQISQNVSRKHSSERENGFETKKIIKIERPGSPPIKTTLSKTLDMPKVSSTTNVDLYKNIFPDAEVLPLQLPPAPPEILSLANSAISPIISSSSGFTGTGPKFRSTLQSVGFANVQSMRPSIKFAINTFANRLHPTPNIIQPSPIMPILQPDILSSIFYPSSWPMPPPPPPEIVQNKINISSRNFSASEHYFDTSIPPPLFNINNGGNESETLPSALQKKSLEKMVMEVDVVKSPINIPNKNFKALAVVMNHSSQQPILNTNIKLVNEVKVEDISPTDTYSLQSQPSSEKIEEEETAIEVVVEKVKPFEKNSDWIETFNDEGIIYYYHKETRQARWDEPPPKEIEGLQSKSVPKNSSQNVIRNEKAESGNNGAEELKKNFKLEVWRHVHNYLTSKKEISKNLDENILTQFARKMTHFTLNDEMKKGNKKFHINDAVFGKARKFTDQNFSTLVEQLVKREPPTA